jgi:N-dimethylarginine dimethylaminohydrolase
MLLPWVVNLVMVRWAMGWPKNVLHIKLHFAIIKHDLALALVLDSALHDNFR